MQIRTVLTTLALAFLLLGLSTPSALRAEEKANLSVDGSHAKEFIRFLASDDLEGRRSGTEGYRKAADWAASQFQEWGLLPAGEEGGYFQSVPMREFDWLTGVPRLSIASRVFLLDDDDFSVNPVSTAATSVDAEVVFVGYGISAPSKGLDEYAGVDVNGKVVLAFKGSPTTAPEGRRMFSRRPPEGEGGEERKDEWEEEAKDETKIRTAYDHGAAAILLYDPETSTDDTARRFSFRRRSEGDEFRPERGFLAFEIEERVYRAILKGEPQESPAGTRRATDATRRDIKKKEPRSRATGVRAALKGYDAKTRISTENGSATARNVLGKIEGTDPERRDEVVLVGAHLDHTGMRDGYVNNGADDNASGSAVLLEVARTLALGGFQPKRTVLFALWCGEEAGLLGSNHYASHPCDGVSIDRVVACFNLDMVGLGDAIDASGAMNFPDIWKIIERDQDPEIAKVIRASEGGPGGSDHSAFIVKGIEALHIMTSGGVGHPDYHQPEDDAEKMDPEILRKTGQFVLQGVVNLANETETNLLIENREARYNALRMRISNVNPGLEGSAWRVVTLEPKNAAALTEQMLDRSIAMLEEEPADASSTRGASSRGPVSFGGRGAAARPRISRSASNGLADLTPFEGDVDLLRRASKLYGFGRVDIHGDDGAWIAEGRLTEKGRAALEMLEKEQILVHLVAPSDDLLSDFLGAASKPFFVTGKTDVDESAAARIAEKGVVLGIDFDPENVDDFIARLEEAKNRVGKRECLVAYLTSTKGLSEARQPLYLGLFERGWAPREIAGDRYRRGGIAGGNLDAIAGGSTSSRRFQR